MKVLVYGTLKKGGELSYYLSQSKYLYTVEITIPNVAMYRVAASVGFGYPALVVGEETKPFVGEIYEIDDETLYNLDVAEGYPRFYQREEIDLGEKYGKVLLYYLPSDLAKEACDLTRPINNWSVKHGKDHTFSD